MTEPDSLALADLVQRYVAARWGRVPDKASATEFGGRLDARTRNRVDMLGGDAEQLLAVDADRVMSEVGRLEQEAALEDAGIRPSAGATTAGGAHHDRGSDRGEATMVRHTANGKWRPNRLGKRRGGG